MSRYKLLGEFWDGVEYDNNPKLTKRNIDNIIYYSSNKSLLDYDLYKRKINLSELLSINSVEKMDEIISKIENCDEVFIEIDYIPKYNNTIIMDFYNKRKNQIYSYIRNRLKSNVKLYFNCKQ